MQTLASWLTLPENSAAACAAARVAECVCEGGRQRAVNPLFLHGPPGSGKSHLVACLCAEIAASRPSLQLCVLPAADLDGLARPDDPAPELQSARTADVLAFEDLQHLSPRAVELLVHLLDRALAGQRQVVCTALVGPAQLDHLPARLTSRLAQGLVCGLLPLGPVSRLAYLRDLARRRPLPGLSDEALSWLAEHAAGSGRALEGAYARLEALTRANGRAPTAAEVAEQFAPEADSRRPTLERIVRHVGGYFRVEAVELRSRRRTREALVPRQVGMYLARQLTELSLQQIGAYFGGRDHSTVLHAVRKVEHALVHDPALSGAVRRLHADLA